MTLRPVTSIDIPSFTFESISAKKLDRDTAYDEIVGILVDPDRFLKEAFYYTSMNKKLYEILSSLTFSKWFCKQGAEKRNEVMKVRSFVFELMIAWLVRLHNKQALVFPMLSISLLALKCHIPTLFWMFLLHIRLIYSQNYAKRLALDMGDRLCFNDLMKCKQGTCNQIAVATFDNCLLRFNKFYEGVAADGDGNIIYNLINWNYMLFNNSNIFEFDSSGPWIRGTNESVVAWLCDDDPLV